MKPTPFIFALTIVVAAFAAGWFFSAWRTPLRQQSVETGSESQQFAQPPVFAQGRLLPNGGIYNVVAPPGQRIASLLVNENDQVVAQESELATLEALEGLVVQSQLTDAQSESAENDLQQKTMAAENNLLLARSNVRSAQLNLEQAEAAGDFSVPEQQLEQARAKLDRLHQLARDPQTSLYVSQAQVAEQQLAIKRAEAEFDHSRRKQTAAVEGAKMALEVAKQSDLAAEKAFEMLKKMTMDNRASKLTKQLAETQVTNARILAPISGTVLKIFVKPGESVSTTPLMQIGDLSKMECNAEIVDQMIPRVAVGQRAKITHPALPRTLYGTVRQIGRLVGSSTLPNPSPLAMVDRRTVDVRIEIEPTDVEAASVLINLQVTVEIETPSASPAVPDDAEPK
ncbi:MAG: HlyD family efflux transporter periplasmic adaptor subunit [Pirellulaceae bacterium]